MYKIRKTIPCPFCESGNVDALYFPSMREREATRDSGQGGSTLVREFRNIKMPQEYVDEQEELQRVRQRLVSTADSLANQLFEQIKKRW